MSSNSKVFVIVVPEALSGDYVQAVGEYAEAMGVTIEEAHGHADGLMAAFAIRRLRRETRVYAALGKRMGWS